MLWHKRLGHVSLSLLNKLISKDLVVGVPSIKFNNDKVCDACARGKQVRKSFKLKNYVSTTLPLELLHVDLCGLMRITSRGGKMYALVIVGGYSRFTWTLFLASKDETFTVRLTKCLIKEPCVLRKVCLCYLMKLTLWFRVMHRMKNMNWALHRKICCSCMRKVSALRMDQGLELICWKVGKV